MRTELIENTLEFVFKAKSNSVTFSIVDFMSKLEKIEGVKDVEFLNIHKI